MKNVIKKVFIFSAIFVFMIYGEKVDAAGISVTASNSVITKGESVKVTATFSSSSLTFLSEGTLICSGAGVNNKLELGSGQKMNEAATLSYSFSIKPTSSGTVTCSTSGAKMVEATDPNTWQDVSGSVTITVKEPVVVSKPTKEYSSNNYLKSLGIDGFDITPSFDKEVSEYSAEVPNGTEKVTIKAEKDNSYAKVSGDGEVSVTEGANKIEVKVTAENGNERVYVINVTVKELDPIEVTIDKKKYTIIRKEGVLEEIDNYEKSTVKIGNEDVLCYKNKVTKSVLVGIKDSDGKASYYVYNEKDNSYTKYNGIHIGNIYLSILDMPKDKIPSGYTKKVFEYENEKLTGYVSNASSSFYLIYGQNEITGKNGVYVFDKEEASLSRYNDDLAVVYKNKADSYFLCFLITLGVLAIFSITFAIILIKGKNNKHKIKHKKSLM